MFFCVKFFHCLEISFWKSMAESNSSDSSLKTVSYINATVTLILALGAIFPNVIILIIYCRNKNVRNMNNVVVTFLSICDLIRGVVIMLIKTYNHYTLVTNLMEPLCTITAVTSFHFRFQPSTTCSNSCRAIFKNSTVECSII